MFIGRKDDIDFFTDVVFKEREKGLTIIPVEGPGGIGKTTFINKVLSHEELQRTKHLFISLDGHTPGMNILFKLEKMINQVIRDLLPDDGEPYFSLTKQAISIQRELNKKIEKEVSDTLVNEEQKEALSSILELGAHLMKFTPEFHGIKLPQDVSRKDIEELIDKSNKVSEKLKLKTGFFPTLKRKISKTARVEDNLLNNFDEYISDCFFVDIACILSGWRKADKSKFGSILPNKCKDFNHLVLLIDDFESFQNNIGISFVLEKLVPKLERRAHFSAKLILSTRDNLSNDATWKHRYGTQLRETRVQLTPLSKEEVSEFLTHNNLDSKLIEEIYNETEGIPLLLDTYLEEQNNPTANGLSQFIRRQTQWMTDQQKSWLMDLSYLNIINVESIAHVLPDEDSELVFRWFESEGSIRDSKSEDYQIIPFIRNRLQKYLKKKYPKKHAEVEKKLTSY